VITFDPKKDAINKKQHGISLVRAEEIDFDWATFFVDDREDYGELRMQAIGFLGARLYSLIFVQDGIDIRAISLRKATRHEQKAYEENQ
jgi:uncharacterized DUF497 family protein